MVYGPLLIVFNEKYYILHPIYFFIATCLTLPKLDINFLFWPSEVVDDRFSYFQTGLVGPAVYQWDCPPSPPLTPAVHTDMIVVLIFLLSSQPGS